MIITKYCLTCNKKILRYYATIKNNKNCFCSNKCHADWSSKHLSGKNSLWWRRIIVKCKTCNKKFYRKPYDIKRCKNDFCSLECRNIGYSKYHKGKNAHTWLGGISFEPYGIKFNNDLKEQIRKRDKYKCQECGHIQKQLKDKLNIHHIDYNKKNNIPENLISLCRSCHAQTGYERKDWIKYFKRRIV